MERTDILVQFTKIFRDQLDNDEIELRAETVPKDIAGWNSFTHIQLVVAIEKFYKIRFKAAEMSTFQNVGDMCDNIIKKLSVA